MDAQAQSVSETVPGRDELLSRAKMLAPLLRQRAAECETLGRAPDATVADWARSKVLRSCQPRRFGGSELGFDTLCEISMELARGDGSQAWVANVYAEHVFFLALFDDQAQHDVWDANPDAMIAASVIPQGNVVSEVPGGYRLTGRWSFASGVHTADWVFLGENIGANSKPGAHLYFLVPANDYVIDDDWHTVGMVGTGSATAVLQDIFVPAHRAIKNQDVMNGTTPGTHVNRAAVYRMPLMGFAQLALASVVVGTSMGMVDEFKQILKNKSGAKAVPAGAELLLERLCEADVETRSAALLLLDRTRMVMNLLEEGKRLDDADAARTMADSAYATKLARQAAYRIFESVGSRGQFLSENIQRSFRNVLTGASHASLNWERSAVRAANLAISES